MSNGSAAAPQVDDSLLRVRELKVAFPTHRGVAVVVRGVDLDVRRGEVLGLVGESGSGKSLTCRAILGLVPAPGEVIDGEVLLDGEDLLRLSLRRLRRIRGSRVAMVFQDPSTSLDPVVRIGAQLVEVLGLEGRLSARAAERRAIELLDHVGIAQAASRFHSYPHELSGGMRQRVTIALAVARSPELLLADEPTTALDVTVQAQILDLLASLQTELNMGMVLVSHDLGVVAQHCDRVAVMYAGYVVEVAPAADLFAHPAHPYTRGLLRSLLPLVRAGEGGRIRSIPGQPPSMYEDAVGCPFIPRCPHAADRCRDVTMELVVARNGHLTACPFTLDHPRIDAEPIAAPQAQRAPAAEESHLSVARVSKSYPRRRSLQGFVRREPRPELRAVSDVSLSVARGGSLGIVGESGSGKTTLARCIVGLERPDSGEIVVDGVDVTRATHDELRELRRRVQFIFQDPYTSLNPRMTIGAAIYEAGRVHGRSDASSRHHFVRGLLAQVGLPAEVETARPKRLSGGQRQRAAIARALAVGPEILVADEAVSALDVSIQAQILNLFQDLRAQLGLTLVFISHQLAVISHTCDDVAVMYLGKVVETGPVAEVFANPQHPYTAALLAAHPTADPLVRNERRLRGELAHDIDLEVGCAFRNRCDYAQPNCFTHTPLLEPVGPEHRVACPVLPFAANRLQVAPRPRGDGCTRSAS